MTGGTSFRAEVGAEAVFERLGRELAGYYRIGIEKDASDAAGEGPADEGAGVRAAGLTVRAREIFDVPHLRGSRLGGAARRRNRWSVPATEIGLRMTSYLSADPADSTRLRLLVSGEATRAQRGDGVLHVAVKSLDGRKVTGGQVAINNSGGDALPFSMNLGVAPGSYVVRLGVMDAPDASGRWTTASTCTTSRSARVGDRPHPPRGARRYGRRARLALSGVRRTSASRSRSIWSDRRTGCPM